MCKHILEAPFMQEAMEACHYFWQAGWGENHAGNLTYLLSIEEEAAYLSGAEVIASMPLTFKAADLAQRCFLVTRSGAFFKRMKKYPERDFGIVRIKEDGMGIDLLWGLEGGGKPTSEFPAHLLCHSARRGKDPANRLVLHCHPTYTIAMTFKHTLDEAAFTKTLWQLNSECILVFPEGVGLLPWMVCGEGAIGPATAKKMEEFRVVVWPHHGIFACGKSIDEAVGLIETVEKNALVYMISGGTFRQSITTEQLKSLAAAFGLAPRPGIL